MAKVLWKPKLKKSVVFRHSFHDLYIEE